MGIVLAAGALADLTGAGLDPPGAAVPLGSLGVELHRYRSYRPDRYGNGDAPVTPDRRCCSA